MPATELHQPVQTPPPETDIAIVGGGMVGLSLALMLANTLPDASITLLESLPFAANTESEAQARAYQPSFDARTSALAYGSRALLDAMGVWDELAEHITSVRTVHVSDRGHIAGCRMTAEEYSVPALGYVTDNRWLGHCLLKAARQRENITLVAPCEVQQAQAVAKGYRLTVNSQGECHTVTAKLAVVADGARSRLRQSLGIEATTKHYEQTAIIANVAFSQPHQGVAYERFTAEGPVAILPRGESPEAREGALIWTRPHQSAEALAECAESDFAKQLQQAFGHRLGRFVRIGERTVYPLQLIQANEQIRPHVVLMGNAAHALHPVAGQGFNLSLRDCARLAEVMAAKQKAGSPLGDLSSVQAYQQAQARDQQLTVNFSDLLPRLFSSRHPLQAAARGLGLWCLELLPQAKAQLAQQSMGQRGRGFHGLGAISTTPATAKSLAKSVGA